MMKYKIVESESIFTGEIQKFVSIEKEDGSFEVFAVDEANPRYAQFLAEQE